MPCHVVRFAKSAGRSTSSIFAPWLLRRDFAFSHASRRPGPEASSQRWVLANAMREPLTENVLVDDVDEDDNLGATSSSSSTSWNIFASKSKSSTVRAKKPGVSQVMENWARPSREIAPQVG
jgi:hypothetical protein